MKKIICFQFFYLVFAALFAITGCIVTEARGREADAGRSCAVKTVTAPVIIDKPVRLTELREQLMREYSVKHYDEAMTEIVPRVVIVHWTASGEAAGVHQYFYREARADGTLNVCSQFLVDRDGTIYRLTPETMLDRHAIGYNWCAIGIENVGGVNDAEDLTDAQLQANLALIRYLKEKYPTIQYAWGHYQQVAAKQSGLYKENVPGYFNPKVDPGPKFMQALQKNLKASGLKFFKP